MNQRQIAKAHTHKKIMQVTKELMIKQGIIKLTAKDISSACEIAHGSLFLHFASMDNLLNEVIYEELIRMGERLYQVIGGSNDIEELIAVYLDMVEKEEPFLARLSQEFVFLSEEMQKHILSLECIHRNFFYTSIETGINAGIYKPVDITSALTAFSASYSIT